MWLALENRNQNPLETRPFFKQNLVLTGMALEGVVDKQLRGVTSFWMPLATPLKHKWPVLEKHLELFNIHNHQRHK